MARNLSAVLDEVDPGETVVVTRGGRQLALLTAVPASNGDPVTAALGELPDDA